MLWIAVAVVVVVGGVALAWWSSGRAKPGDLQRRIDGGSVDAKAQAQIRCTDASGPRSL